MSVADGPKNILHCHHCGREVRETTHTRSAYRVDYYSLHTGDVEATMLSRHDDPAEPVTVLRLVKPNDVFSCVDCYRKPAVRSARELLFRPEAAAS
ncbi:MAG TPA: hypothetical protein VN812_02175 [Candidatus Acidoferrales bacterium]|nr:hypothetical protein [Candidatus Acidoferrales bacterium]